MSLLCTIKSSHLYLWKAETFLCSESLLALQSVLYFHSSAYRSDSRDRLVVRTLRCGRSNPGSNPGHGSVKSLLRRSNILFAILIQL